jgi:hypothetical protein
MFIALHVHKGKNRVSLAKGEIIQILISRTKIIITIILFLDLWMRKHPCLNKLSLFIEKVIVDMMPHPREVILQIFTQNPNVETTQHYNIVEYLSHEPCAMST